MIGIMDMRFGLIVSEIVILLNNSKSQGVRISRVLYELVIRENPNKNFTEIIRDLLFKEYGSKLCAQDTKNNDAAATESVSNNVVVHSSDDIDSLIDELFSDSCAQVKTKGF